MKKVQHLVIKILLVNLILLAFVYFFVTVGVAVYKYYLEDNVANRNQVIGIVETIAKNRVLIGNYRHESASMCYTGCDSYYVDAIHKLTSKIDGVSGEWDKQELLLVEGDWVIMNDYPTVAGPQSRGIEKDEIETILTKRFKVNKYQRITFGEVSISEEEFSDYLNNKDAYFDVKFINPLNRKVEINLSLGKVNDFNFQSLALEPKEEKVFKYKFNKTNKQSNERSVEDELRLTIINGFADSYKYYYSDISERENNEEPMISIEKFIDLDDIVKL